MITRRDALAGMAGLTASAWLPAFNANAGPLSYEMTPVKLADGAWMVAGAQEAITRKNGGAIANIGILDSRDGAIVIDTGPSRRYGEELAKLAQELTGKPVVRAYLTHFHPDHVFGNQAFGPDKIVAPQGVIDGLKLAGEDFATAMYHLAGDWMRGTELVLPGKAVGDGVEQVGERRLRHMVLKGHTDTDLVIFDENSGVLFAGDLSFLDRAPTTPHADLAAWRASLDKLEAIDQKKLVSGHGPAEDGKRGIRQTRNWLDAMEAAIRDAFERGLAMTEAMAVPLPAFTKKIALARYEFERSVMHFYPKLEAGEWPRVDQKT